MIVIEIKQRKRLSKRVKTEFFKLGPGETWQTHLGRAGVTFLTNPHNIETVFIGRAK